MHGPWVAPNGTNDRPSSNADRRRPIRRRWTAVGLVGLLFTATACRSSTAPNTLPDSTRSPAAIPSPSVDPAVAEATTKAVAAYQGYVAAYARAANTANVNDPNLPHYIGGGLLSLSQHNLRLLGEHEAIELGTPTATVLSTKVKLAAKPPTVTISACVDYSSYQLVYKSNQSPVPNSALKVKKYTTTATVQLYTGGLWLVSADDPHRDAPC